VRYKKFLEEIPEYGPERIVRIRETYEWTQAEFACALNVSRPTVANWETGHKKPSGAAVRLLDLFRHERPTVLRAIARHHKGGYPYSGDDKAEAHLAKSK
jgi:DNA-binding transcriptional regulator YiaG